MECAIFSSSGARAGTTEETIDMNELKVAVLGLGAMGARMARRLIEAGHDVTVYNRNSERATPLVDAGARWASTPREAASGREVVIAMVRDDDASRAVWLDPQTGALRALAPGAVAVECSTLTPGWSRRLAAAATEAGRRVLEAPVVGSRPQAEAGQLAILAGGDAETLEAARPALDALAGAVHHVGPVGAGATMKLVVNTLFAAQVALFGELLGVCRAAGITAGSALEVLGALPVTSPALKGVGGLVVAGKFAPMFPIELVEKDLGYLVATAEAADCDAPTSRAVREVYDRARDAGLSDENIAAVVKLFIDAPSAT
jgi:3-hydroxyisobutyrate dehydrogenase